MTAHVTATTHTMVRVDIATEMASDVFQEAFERAAPIFDPTTVLDITARGGSWDDVRAAVAANAPNGLMIFTRIDATPLMSAAGHHTRAIEYLLGNHVVAESMFRHDAKVLLYVPLRILIHDDANGDAIFTLDQPSTVLAGLDDSEITAVGAELDQKVAHLLDVIGVDANGVFSARERPS
ncbi:DUF302 domain-containing protein [Mycolicibacterium hodleri]|uniref:DUF302 domain-containing protein n=1 Tax=Mycolicibacterium hodleri TaxID=49897 RepID=A0A502EBD7_9MYCO|nr:DUF302 domain-containing protein [Mycolicibacterium hodleri]TPG35045.1 DUF302 domain-containing protein [Mycolicibacterium hodleri]